MVTNITRRDFLAAGLAAALVPGVAYAAPALTGKTRIVILGGGFGGARTARLLREFVPEANIRLIEENEYFIPGVSVLPFFFDDRPISSIRYDYRQFKALNIDVVRAKINGVNPAAGTVETTAGPIQYDYLVVATGTRYDLAAVKGLSDLPQENVSPFDKSRLESSRQRLQALKKGTAVISISDTSKMCPPAPYEFTLLLAAYFRRRGLDNNIIVLDANLNPQPGPVSPYFERHLATYGGAVEYMPATGDAIAVDTGAKRVFTRNGEEVPYSLLSVFPAGSVASWIPSIGSSIPGDLYLEVSPVTLRTRQHSNIYGIGDVARLPYGKSAYAATICADRCARDIALRLGKKIANSKQEVNVACFPYVSPTEAVSMRVQYLISKDKDGDHLSSKTVTEPASTAILATRTEWERETLRQTFL